MYIRDYLSWWLRPKFLKDPSKRKKILFAGPWVGEFGWELMNWQGLVRKVASNYERVIVCCRPGNEALYEDFADEIITHTIHGTADCNRLKQIKNPEEAQRIKSLISQDYDHLYPLGQQPIERQEFIKYGIHDDKLAYDIIFHPRGRDFGEGRNWPKEYWLELLTRLKKDGKRLACIGLSGATLNIPNEDLFDDLRDIPLKQTLNLLASSSLVIGPSSGPMHLASLCGTPHLVWTDREKYAQGRINREKYEYWWNPLGTKVEVIDDEGFKPGVEKVYRLVRRNLL